MDIATLGLRVDGTGAIRTVDAFTASTTRAAAAGARAESTASRLRTTFMRLAAVAGISLGVREVINYADSWNLVEGRIALVTKTSAEAAAVQNQLFASAQRSRQGFEGVADLYTRLARASQNLGATQQRVLNVTDTINKSFVVSGGSAQASAAAIIQLGQALGSGVLRGEELNSVLEQAPRLAQAIAEGLGTDTTQLKRLGEQGKLTSQQVFQALESQRAKIEEEFKRMPVTIGQSFTVLTNEVRKYIGGADDATGASRLFGGAILLIARNLGTLVKVLTFAVTLWGTYSVVIQAAALKTALLTAASTAAATGVGVLTLAARGLVAVLTGPLGIALALTAVITLLLNYKSAADKAAEAERRFTEAIQGTTEAQLKDTQARTLNELSRNRQAIEAMQRAGTDTMKNEAGLPIQTRAFREAIAERDRLLSEYGATVTETWRREEEASTAARASATSMSKSQRDAIRERVQQNAEMVKQAQDAVRLAREQGMEQERLAIEMDAATKAMQARADVETRSVLPATLAAIEAEKRLKLEALDVAAFRAQAQAREDLARTTQQAAALADLEGAAQTHLRTEYEALNRTIEARRNLGEGALFDRAAEDIETERVARLSEERLKIIREYRAQVREIAVGLFEDISANGFKAIGNLFERIRSLALRFFAEMAAKKFMAAIGDRWGEQLARAFGGVDKLEGPKDRAAVALTGSATALSGAASALSAAAVRLGGPMGGGASPEATALAYGGAAARAANRPPAVALDPLVVTTQRRQSEESARQSADAFAKVFTKVIGPALVGYTSGRAIGAGTTNRGLGALGGAASGAAAGYMMGGPVGAIVGGISGAVGGFIGASKRRAEEEALLREVLNRNAERIRELSENIQGLTLMSGKNLAAAAAFTGGVAGKGLIQGLLGQLIAGAFGGVSSKDLAAALKGEGTTAALRRYEQQFGVTLQDVGRIARQMGIELYDSAGKLIPAAFRQLHEAIQLEIKARTQFTASLDDQRLRQEARNKLFDIPDTPVNRLNDQYEILQKGAPELLKQMGLANLNLASEAGRKVLLSGLQEIYRLIESGNLTPELLGAFKDKEGLIRALLDAKDGLDAFKNALGNVTTDFPRAMDLILYEQRYGRGTGASAPTVTRVAPPAPVDTNPGGAPRAPQRPLTVGQIVVYYTGEDTPRDLADDIQEALRIAASRGGGVIGQTFAPESNA